MYEDYMQNLLGANFSPYMNTYEQNTRQPQYFDQMDNYLYEFNMPYCCYEDDNIMNDRTSELEDCYPEIYKIVYPMVKKACSQNTKPLSRDLVDELTHDIYSHIEAENIVNVNINVDNNNTVQNNRNQSVPHSQQTPNRVVSSPSVKRIEETEKRESRQANNPIMDLVRILLIRELLGRPGNNRPPRPYPPRPFPPRPMPPRPTPPGPFPPRPGMPGNPPPRPMPR